MCFPPSRFSICRCDSLYDVWVFRPPFGFSAVEVLRPPFGFAVVGFSSAVWVFCRWGCAPLGAMFDFEEMIQLRCKGTCRDKVLGDSYSGQSVVGSCRCQPKKMTGRWLLPRQRVAVFFGLAAAAQSGQVAGCWCSWLQIELIGQVPSVGVSAGSQRNLNELQRFWLCWGISRHASPMLARLCNLCVVHSAYQM